MILQRLNQYYERKLAEEDIAPPGYEYREIPYLIILTNKGAFVRFESQYLDEKRKRSRRYLVPKSVERSSNTNPNLLWDNAKYILKEPDKQAAFLVRLKSFRAYCDDDALDALIRLLGNNGDGWQKDPLYSEIIAEKNDPALTFKLDNDSDIICVRRRIMDSRFTNPYDFDEQFDNPSLPVDGFCIVDGNNASIAKIHPTITGVRETNQNRGNIVSFNKDKGAFDSFGKQQGFNAPISKKAAFAYTTALNTMLSSERRQRMYVGDTTIVFWGEKGSKLEEDGFLGLFTDPEHEKGRQKEAELQRLESLRFLLESPKSGKRPLDEETTGFYVLGLGPNSARISIRFWYEGSVAQTAANLRQYFQDLQIVKPEFESGFLSLKRLLRSTAVREEEKNIVPELSSRLFQAILRSEPFPRIVLDRALARIKADHSEFAERNLFPRVALIKAYLNRMGRTGRIPGFQEVTTDMDEENQNIGYNLGRFFAVLERAQEAANPGINTTIRDRYFTSACTRPGTVFPVLVNLSMHHVSKAGGGLEIYFEKLKAKVLGNVSRFPLVLSLEDQGHFALGYYHQRQVFFTKKEGGKE